MIVRSTEAGGFVWVNRVFAEQLGRTMDDLVQSERLDWIDPRERPPLEQALAALASGRRAPSLAPDGAIGRCESNP